VEETALGETEGRADFFVVASKETGCNSLRQPRQSIPRGRSRFRSSVWILFATSQIERVDFIKLDVEGAELSVLKERVRFSNAGPVPFFYAKCRICAQRHGLPCPGNNQVPCLAGYGWFMLLEDGSLRMVNTNGRKEWDGNFAAVPLERSEDLRNRGLLAT